MQLEDRDLGCLWRWEADGGQHRFELRARPTRSEVLLRVPDADEVQRALAGRAVVPQLTEPGRTAPAHDHGVRPVVCLGLGADVAVDTRDEHDRHVAPPSASALD